MRFNYEVSPIDIDEHSQRLILTWCDFNQRTGSSNRGGFGWIEIQIHIEEKILYGKILKIWLLKKLWNQGRYEKNLPKSRISISAQNRGKNINLLWKEDILWKKNDLLEFNYLLQVQKEGIDITTKLRINSYYGC